MYIGAFNHLAATVLVHNTGEGFIEWHKAHKLLYSMLITSHIVNFHAAFLSFLEECSSVK